VNGAVKGVARAAVRLAFAGALALSAVPAAALSCSLQSPGLVFGAYNPLSLAPVDSASSVTVTCTALPGASIVYTLRLGPGGSGSFSERRMRSAAQWALTYNLYTNPARTLVWGDGNGGSQVVSDALTLSAPSASRVHPVYGRLFARQNVPPGTYVDTLVLTVDF
jgi:spore coat protein U-like protein